MASDNQTHPFYVCIFLQVILDSMKVKLCLSWSIWTFIEASKPMMKYTFLLCFFPLHLTRIFKRWDVFYWYCLALFSSVRLVMRSALLFLVHFKIFLGLQSSIGILQHLIDIVWIFFFFANWFWMFVLIALSFSVDLALNSSTWLILDPLPSLLMMISYVECFFFLISWKLIEVSFQHDPCIKIHHFIMR